VIFPDWFTKTIIGGAVLRRPERVEAKLSFWDATKRTGKGARHSVRASPGGQRSGRPTEADHRWLPPLTKLRLFLQTGVLPFDRYVG